MPSRIWAVFLTTCFTSSYRRRESDDSSFLSLHDEAYRFRSTAVASSTNANTTQQVFSAYVFTGTQIKRHNDITVDQKCFDALEKTNMCEVGAQTYVKYQFVLCGPWTEKDSLRVGAIPAECSSFAPRKQKGYSAQIKNLISKRGWDVCCSRFQSRCCTTSKTFIILVVLLASLFFAAITGVLWYLCCVPPYKFPGLPQRCR
eukprot:TRINITY_DN24409_c1_g6_i1.p1 TRINITY_DN24409_c1_g6~~TRINITY_DN24409_c1_g6_i1.p1  ORF type:complete len:202 (+),score=0.21 TRINITY_DN24409_c1_g6_i1:65-670(+)